MSITSFSSSITGFYAGDNARIEQSFPLPDSLAEARSYVSKVWFTVKVQPNDADVDKLFEIEITETASAGGAILEPTHAAGWTNGLKVQFDLTPEQTELFIPELGYFYSIKLLGENGWVETVDTGIITASQGVRKAGV